MELKEALHITDLVNKIDCVRKERLNGFERNACPSENRFVQQLLLRYPAERDALTLKTAFSDSYFPLPMLAQTLFADVVGMRFYINKQRPDLESALSRELLGWAAAFLRIRRDIQTFFNPKTITCIPVDGKRHPLPTEQWCTLCGVCCQIGGVPPAPPPGIQYPDHWPGLLAGETVENQQLCPFLFQYFGEDRFFCSIHNIKPAACRRFGRKECRKRLTDIDLHQKPL